MKKDSLNIVMLMIFMICTSLTYAQADNNESTTQDTIVENTKPAFKKYVYLSGNVGLGLLGGDNTQFKLGYNGNIGVGFQFDRYMGIKFNLGYGTLNGGYDNVELYGGTHNFDLKELNYFRANFDVTLNLTHLIFGYNPDRKFHIIPHVGLGQMQYRVDILNKDTGNTYYKEGFTSVDSSKDGGINARKIVATIPFGIEFDFNINKRWSIYLDLTANYQDSDWFDGVNGNYLNDWYYSFNLGTNCRLGRIDEEYYEQTCDYWYMTFDGGAAFLFGDNIANFSILRGNVNLGGGYNFRDYYRIYAKIGTGNYRGQRTGEWEITKATYYTANINFAANVIGLIQKSNDSRIELYPHVGIGQTQYKSAINYYTENTQKQVGQNNDYDYNLKGEGINGRRVAMTFPLGIELVYNLNDRTDFYADVTAYLTQSDLLDCLVSGKRNDAYSTVNIGLRYKFNKACLYDSSDECCMTLEEVKDAIKEALEEHKPAEQQPGITPEDVKRAVKEALEEYGASQPKETVINNNFSDISFPKSEAQKVKTQTKIEALDRASLQVINGSAVSKIVIEGYASPEGNSEFNETLALQRAEEAAVLIKQELGEISDENIEIVSKGADWDGLYASLANSEIEDKNQIIEKLKSSSNREVTLQELLITYPQINDLFPQLRRASIIITTVQ